MAQFDAVFERSPVRRAGRDGFVRNVCVALGNRGEAGAAASLALTLESDPSALVRMHAAWALGEIGRRLGAENASCSVKDVRDRLEGASRDDLDPSVREEANAALERLL